MLQDNNLEYVISKIPNKMPNIKGTYININNLINIDNHNIKNHYLDVDYLILIESINQNI